VDGVGEDTTDHIGEDITEPATGAVRRDLQILLQILTPLQTLLQLLIPQLIPQPTPQQIPGMDTMAMAYVDGDGVVGEVTTDHIGEDTLDTGAVRKDPLILLQLLTPQQILLQ